MELTTSWEERGIEKGLEKGLEKGRERECQLILRQLRRRFGPLERSAEAGIRELSFDQLDKLGLASVDFASVADLKKWLAAH